MSSNFHIGSVIGLGLNCRCGNGIIFQNWGIKKSAVFFENRHISKGGPLQTQIFDVVKFQNRFIHGVGLDLHLRKMVLFVKIGSP